MNETNAIRSEARKAALLQSSSKLLEKRKKKYFAARSAMHSTRNARLRERRAAETRVMELEINESADVLNGIIKRFNADNTQALPEVRGA